jgi:RNA polymerase sigma factor (sigma-70 family)
MRKQRINEAVQNYGKRLFRFIRNRVSSDEDAEDILQDVWYQLSAIIDTEPVGQLSAWLYRVSRNRIVDRNRRQDMLALEDLVYEDEDGNPVFPEALLTESNDPSGEMERAHFREMFFAALNELPANQRDVFVWNELEDMTLQQIADKTGEKLKTIISRKRYAVAQLRKRLQKYYDEY